jgi:hypothetical protein
MACDAEGVPTAAIFYKISQQDDMDTSALLIIIIIVLIILGGGWYGRGRCNQQEPGWEDTLTGVPKQLYQFWHKSLRPRGYKLRAQIVDFPGGLPGDISMTLKWG